MKFNRRRRRSIDMQSVQKSDSTAEHGGIFRLDDHSDPLSPDRQMLRNHWGGVCHKLTSDSNTMGCIEPGSHPKRMTYEVRTATYTGQTNNKHRRGVTPLANGTCYYEVQVPVKDQRPMASDRRPSWVRKRDKLSQRYGYSHQPIRNDLKIAKAAAIKRDNKQRQADRKANFLAQQAATCA